MLQVVATCFTDSSTDTKSIITRTLSCSRRCSWLITADKCKNCAKCGKGLKIGTNEAYNIKIKIRIGGILKIFGFCSYANMISIRPEKYAKTDESAYFWHSFCDAPGLLQRISVKIALNVVKA